MVNYIDTTINNISYNIESYDLSVVVPVYNESETIKTVLRDWDIVFKENEISYCYVLVNDGSKDNSLEVMKSLKYNIFLLDKHKSGMEEISFVI